VTDSLTPDEVRRALGGKTKRRENPETAIKRQVKQYLVINGWCVWNLWQGQFSEKGIADLVALRDGRTVWVEIKTATGKQSPDQVAFEEAIKRAGGEYHVSRGIDDLGWAGRGEVRP
jgi:hypothetical protein